MTVTCKDGVNGVEWWASPGCHRGSSSGTQKHSACQFDVGVLYRLHRKVGNREQGGQICRSVNSSDLVMPYFRTVNTWMKIWRCEPSNMTYPRPDKMPVEIHDSGAG